MSYACTAKIASGARCRNFVMNDGDRFCSQHSAMPRVEAISQPDTVLYKFNLNETWRKKMVALGVPVKEPNFQQKEQKHVEHAEQHGREAFRFRKDVADSGVPVFGPKGVQSVSLYEVLQELLEIYEVVDVHIRPRRDGNRFMSVLVVSFSHGEKACSNTKAFQELLDFLSSSCWGYTHVWANPPQEDGRVVNTINSSHREEGKKATNVLRFDEGRWSVDEKVS